MNVILAPPTAESLDCNRQNASSLLGVRTRRCMLSALRKKGSGQRVKSGFFATFRLIPIVIWTLETEQGSIVPC